MYAHPTAYPDNMTRELFVEHLGDYQDGMNMHNGCNFPSLSDEQVDEIFADYQKWWKSWN